MPPKRFLKGSQEAKDYMRMLREKRGGAKISRPSVDKGTPKSAKVEGGKIKGKAIPPPPSRSYDTSFEDKIDGVMLSGGCLNDCPTCCGMGIVKLKK